MDAVAEFDRDIATDETVFKIGRRAIVGGLEKARVEADANGPVFQGELVTGSEGGKRPPLDERRKRVFFNEPGIGRAHIDDPGEGIGPVKRTGGTFRDLDGLERGDVEILELVNAGKTGRETASVEEHDRVVALHSANEKGSLRPHLSGLDEVDPGGLAEDVAKIVALAGADLRSGDGVNGGEEFGFRRGSWLERLRRDRRRVELLHGLLSDDDGPGRTRRLHDGDVEGRDFIDDSGSDFFPGMAGESKKENGRERK